MIVKSRTMVYTCYEMIRDCRADRPEGWRYFIANYIPVIRRVLAHYQPATPDGTLEHILDMVRRPESGLFQGLDPALERPFVAQLRQKVLSELPARQPSTVLELDTLAAALQPLTLVEKQVAWLESMLYSSSEAGVLLRMAPPTVDKIRARAAELVRGKVDSWSSTLLADNGIALGKAAAEKASGECLPPKLFLDLLDGRTTWRGREELESHVNGCWHCIDHLCRLVEVVELLRGNQPLPQAEAEPYEKRLGLPRQKQSGWKRWLGQESGD